MDKSMFQPSLKTRKKESPPLFDKVGLCVLNTNADCNVKMSM